MKQKREVILTARVGTNADQFPDVLAMYVPEGSRVADVTWGKGVFWKNVDTDNYDLVATDLQTGGDLRDTGYQSASFDAVVLDPPYMHTGKAPIKESINRTYNNNSITGGSRQVRDLYYRGMLEGWRILRSGGHLIVKCMDEIESGRQQLNHIRIIEEAELYGFECVDLFVMVTANIPTMREEHQLHARKNHSYFLVFRKKPATCRKCKKKVKPGIRLPVDDNGRMVRAHVACWNPVSLDKWRD